VLGCTSASIKNCAYAPVAINCGVVQLTLRPAMTPPALALVGTKPTGNVLCSELSVIGGPRLKIVMI
jgi:hypothetical protein